MMFDISVSLVHYEKSLLSSAGLPFEFHSGQRPPQLSSSAGQARPSLRCGVAEVINTSN